MSKYGNILNALQSQIWLILPEKLEAINRVIEEQIIGLKESAAIEAFAERTENAKTQKNYQIINGDIAQIDVIGTIYQRADMATAISGGVSSESVAYKINEALKDQDVKSILLNIDSPGGTVHGVFELAEKIEVFKEQKPIIAYTGGMMASAAYLIGSAASAVIAYESSIIGSVGVLVCHYDYSEKDRQDGLKRTYIYEGKYKGIANEAEPLSESGKQIIHEQIDAYYQMFVSRVAKYRNIEAKNIVEIGASKTYLAKAAAQRGLIDIVGDISAAIAEAKRLSEAKNQIKNNKGANKMSEETIKILALINMTAEQLNEIAPDLYEKIKAEAMQIAEATAKEQEQAILKAEHSKILGLLAVAKTGNAEITDIEKAIKEKMDAGAFAGSLAANFEVDKRTEDERLKEELTSAAAEGKSKSKTETDFMAAVDLYQKNKKCDRGEAMKATVKKHKNLYASYLKQQAQKKD